MKQDRLNNCLLKHCYKSITDTQDTEDCKHDNNVKGILENLSRGMRMAE